MSRLTDRVVQFSQATFDSPVDAAQAKELILQVDGGHIPVQARAKRS